ncbi:DUF3617 family protein [Caulobacter sp. S45]|uniref:DUF3617 domain-containing protein n=1 Tax=Caulobacter sp. S45 TaxID=1641861 RepID=UPI00157668FE|nr:DUF3617 family protein [Caulobacter sp. S45]
MAQGLDANAQPASPVLPGYWESSEQYSLALLSGASHARKCLTQAQVAQFVSSPQTSHYQCSYKSRKVEGGRADFRDGSCYSHRGRLVLSKVEVDGRYAPETFHLDFHFKFMVSPTAGLPGSASIDAHRLGAECPVEPTAGR